MALRIRKRLWLLPVVLTIAGAGGAVDSELRAKLGELEALIKSQHQLIQNQQQQIDSQQDRLSSLEVDGRRLSGALPPSIFGEVTNTTRKYTDLESIQGALTHMWLLICGALVMFMQAGFAMVEAGSCRAKNVQNVMLKNLTDVCVGTLGWYCVGWAIAYGGPTKSVGGTSYKKDLIGHEEFVGMDFLSYTGEGQNEPTSKMLNWFFQWAFCSAAATIVSGGTAERVNFPGYAFYSLMMTTIIYPCIVASTWGYGWLAEINSTGYMDFAGSGIVHMCGGVGALVGAAVAGPRKGRWENPERFVPHSLPLVVLGTFILWFGWYGFNCGSTLSMESNAKGFLAAHVAMNTTLAASVGGLVVFLLRLTPCLGGRYDVAGFCNGILAGLVAITAGCSNVTSYSALAIGAIGGLVYQGASSLMKLLRIDDPVDAFAVHGAAGAWGVLAAVLFDWGTDFDQFHGWSGFKCVTDSNGNCRTNAWTEALAANGLEILFVFVWTALWSLLIFLPLRLCGYLRASDDVQSTGFDEAKHSPSKAYSIDSHVVLEQTRAGPVVPTKPTLHAI